MSPDLREKRRQTCKLRMAGRCRRASQQSTLQSYLATLVTIRPRQAVLTLGLMVCLSLTEGVGLLLLVPLLHLGGKARQDILALPRFW